MVFRSVNDALLLMALGTGYLVLYAAKREEKGLQFIGYIIGWVVIILAAVFLIFGIWIEPDIKYPKMQMRSHKAMRH